jgi:hypothetical protein
MTRPALLIAATVLVAAAPAAARQTVGGGVVFQGYDLHDDLGVRAATLLLTPIAARLSLGDRLEVDAYTAWARGAVDIGGTEFTLSGPVDTRVRASYALTPWAVLTLGLNLPTGASEHDGGEALVAGALSTELLGFREAGWGVGLAATTGLATAYRVGEWGLGFGLSYRHAGEYSPRAGEELVFDPGDELRARLAFDRSVGATQFTAGLTLQHFSEDRADGRNLFQPGSRVRGDASATFRAGTRGTLAAFGAAAWRQRGDVLFDLRTGAPDEATIGGQRLLVAGLMGSFALSPALLVAPAADLRWIARDDAGGDGWLLGGGFDFTARSGRVELLPGGRIRVGRIATREGVDRSVVGGEVALTLRWRN